MSNTPQPISQVLLSIPKALQDEIILDSGLKLYLDPSYKKEWQASVTAIVVALPVKYTKEQKQILNQIKVGDEVIVSYQVVADFDFSSDGLRFMPTTEDNPHMKEFTNGNGEWVKVYALPNFKGISKIQWVGVYQNRQRKVLDGVQGTEMQVERWLSQFQFGKTDEYRFNNFFEHNGKEYWKCDLSQIFAVKRKGHLVAINDRAICKPIDENIPSHLIPNIQHHESVKIRYQDRAKVLTAQRLKKELVVSFNPNHLEKYEIDGKQYYLIRERYVQGLWSKNKMQWQEA